MGATTDAFPLSEKTVSDVRQRPDWIDDVLVGSFPASDPPSWTPGAARPAPTAFTSEEQSLQPGDQVPHFHVMNVQGQVVNYSTIWQQKNLILVTLPVSDPLGWFSKYIGGLSRVAALTAPGTECVITRDVVAGTGRPGALVADRWGEIVHVTRASAVTALPGPDDLLDWFDYLERQCPECQGEAK